MPDTPPVTSPDTQRLTRASCPHGDVSCLCPDGLACHYEGRDAMFCPNPPAATNFCDNLTFAHCHVEGCTWHVRDCAQRVSGECGLIHTLGLEPVTVSEGGSRFYSMAQARPGLPGWACGWLRSSGNEPSTDRCNYA